MKFEVTKMSDSWSFDEEKLPLPGARREEHIRIDRRTFKTPEEHDARCMPPWHSVGTNHRIENGGIVRDMVPEPVWVLDVESIEALAALVAEHGEIIVRQQLDTLPAGYELEVYDGCWE